MKNVVKSVVAMAAAVASMATIADAGRFGGGSIQDTINSNPGVHSSCVPHNHSGITQFEKYDSIFIVNQAWIVVDVKVNGHQHKLAYGQAILAKGDNIQFGYGGGWTSKNRQGSTHDQSVLLVQYNGNAFNTWCGAREDRSRGAKDGHNRLLGNRGVNVVTNWNESAF